MRQLIAPAVVAALLVLYPVRPSAQTAARGAIPALQTRAESSGYKETSHFDDVVAFMQALEKTAPKTIHLTTFGTTVEGRALPLAVVGAADATPAAVKRTGKLRVYIQGNIHGGEVEGKESAQMLLRELAQGRHADWLKSMVLIVAPIYNADGNERFATNNRGRQNGPIAGQGQRPNAQSLDLNRDHMKMESPEAHAFVKLLNDYDPQVLLDLHTTNGSRHGYFLTYAPPLNPSTDPAIVDLLRKQWFPAVTSTIKSKYGWDIYYYGNIEGRPGEERAWRSFDHRPRFNNNYGGLRNRVAILSEAYAYATFEDRILATSRFVDETLTYANAHAAAIKKLVAEADRRPIVGSKLALRAELEKGPEVDILLGEVTEEKNPISGNIMYRRSDVVTPERMPEYGTFKATLTERVPSAYYVPASLTKAVELLRAHGVQMTPLATAQTSDVQEFHILESKTAREFQGHQERSLDGSWSDGRAELSAGTLRIDMKQPLARLAFYLLEPQSDDGVLNWNLLDEALGPDPKVYPIVRTRN